MQRTSQLERASRHHEPLAPASEGHEQSTAPSIKTETLASETSEAPQSRASPAREPPQSPSQPASDSDQAPRSRRRTFLRWALFTLLPIVLIIGGYWYVTGGRVVSTDDAYVEVDKVGISADVAGIVRDVDVTENQHVAAGQVLYRLDPRQFQIALDNARANLAETALTIESMKRDYQRMLSDIDAQQAEVELDQATFDRNAKLVKNDTVSRATYDQARFTLQTEKGKLASLKHQAEVQLAKLAGNPDILVSEHPQYLQTKAAVDEAQRQLDHTVVRAPFAGVVTSVPSIAPGKYLQASMTAFYLVATDYVWVDSNPKETELTYVRPGQPVMIAVDTYPEPEWHGTVESISPAAAQEFQLLPAQNTSGNWVKVVQRIPMRVQVNTSDESLPSLRAGMSVEINVDTRHARGLPHFLAALLD
jgi:membrane fusion protein, multidrug efflux system